MDNTQEIQFMIYRNNKLDKYFAFKAISRRISRVLMRKTYKVLEAILKGADEVVKSANQK